MRLVEIASKLVQTLTDIKKEKKVRKREKVTCMIWVWVGYEDAESYFRSPCIWSPNFVF